MKLDLRVRAQQQVAAQRDLCQLPMCRLQMAHPTVQSPLVRVPFTSWISMRSPGCMACLPATRLTLPSTLTLRCFRLCVWLLAESSLLSTA